MNPASQAVRLDRPAEVGRPRDVLLFTIFVSVVTAGSLLVTDEAWDVIIFWLTAIGIALTWYRPVLGVGAILGLTLLFEQYDFAPFFTITRTVPLFENVSQFTRLESIDANPLELLLVTLCIVVALRGYADAREARANPLAAVVVVFFSAVCGWLVYGVLMGGAVNIALWEVRALSYFCLLALVVPQTIESRRDVRFLIWVSLGAIGFKVVQGVWNYLVVLQGDVSVVRSITSHEDALFIAWLFVYLIALLAWGVRTPQRTFLVGILPLSVVTFVVTDRRAAYAALAIGLCVLLVLVMTDRQRRWQALRVAGATVLCGAIVVGIGWRSAGSIGAPGRVIRSIVAPEVQEDIDSSLYREAEQASLLTSIRAHPVVGLGFGRAFQEKGTLIDIGFSLSNVIPHNEIMWVWAKMGTVGFAVFWAMIGGVIAFGVNTFKRVRDPYLKAVSTLVTCAIIMQLVVSYVDLQLTYSRNMVFLGVLVGVLAALPRIAQGDDVTDSAEVPL